MRALAVIAALCGCNQILGVGNPHLAGSNPDGGGGGDDDQMDAPVDSVVDAPASLARRKPISIGAGKVAASITSFPVYVDLTDAELQATAQANGSDIYFADAAGALLPYEIERWTSTTGRLQAWVLLPSVPTTGVSFYMYWRGTIKPPNPAQLWQQYAAVFHFNDASISALHNSASATSPTVMLVSGSLATGPNGSPAVTFNNIASLAFPHNSIPGLFTISYTAVPDTSQVTNARFLTFTDAGGIDVERVIDLPIPSSWRYRDGQGQGPTTNFPPGQASQVAWVEDQSSVKAYRNGGQVTSLSIAGGAITTNTVVVGMSGQKGYSGLLDELRIRRVAAGPAELKADFDSFLSPATFLTFGANEDSP